MSNQVYVISITKNRSQTIHHKDETSVFDDEYTVKYSNFTGLLGVVILFGSVLLSMIATCVPHHNVIKYPEFWYEAMSPVISWVPIFSARNIIEGRMLLKTNTILGLKSYFLHLICCSLGKLITFITIYIAWTVILGFRNPMPFQGHVTTLLYYTIYFPLSFWFLFPLSIRKKHSTTRTQVVRYLQLVILRILFGIGYTKMPSFPLIKYDKLQWTLGILLPLLKKFNMWWHAKIAFMVSGGDKEVSDIDTIIAIGIMHSFGLALLLGSSRISNITAYIIMISDFLFNAWSCKNIVKLHKQKTMVSKELRDRSIKYLALKEFLEIIVPTIYCFSFTAAYFGPNAELIGNVKLELWGFVSVNSLTDQLWNVGVFIIFDSLRAISIAMVLWHFCKLNLYSAYCYIVRHYGWFILFYGNTIINSVNGCYLLFQVSHSIFLNENKHCISANII